MRRYLLSFLFILLAASCQPIPPTPEGTVPSPTDTATISPFPTVTDTPNPCGTIPCPTETNTETPFPTVTDTPNPCGTIPCVTETETDTPFPTATDTQVPPTATDTPVPPTETPTATPPEVVHKTCDGLPATIYASLGGQERSIRSITGTNRNDVIVVDVYDDQLAPQVYGGSGNDLICVYGDTYRVFINGQSGRDACRYYGLSEQDSYALCEDVKWRAR